MSGDIPWKEKKHSTQIIIQLSKGATPARPHNIFGSHWDLIQQCWAWNPEHRPAATMVGERAEDLIRQYETVCALTIVTCGGQEKVKCGRIGCSSVVPKAGLTRHVTEIHLRKIKHICNRCGRAFTRMYLKKNHEPTCRGRKFGGHSVVIRICSAFLPTSPSLRLRFR